MNKLVTIRSNRYGLDIEFDSETEFDQLLEVLGQKFKQSGRFFKDAQMALSFSGRELTRAEEDRVLAVIRENTQIEILCIIEPNDKNEMMYRSNCKRQCDHNRYVIWICLCRSIRRYVGVCRSTFYAA